MMPKDIVLIVILKFSLLRCSKHNTMRVNMNHKFFITSTTAELYTPNHVSAIRFLSVIPSTKDLKIGAVIINHINN